MSRAAAAPKARPMCCVTIGLEKLLMPREAGLKLVALLGDAVQCRTDYVPGTRGFGERYVTHGEPTRVEYAIVQADQVRLVPKDDEGARSRGAKAMLLSQADASKVAP